MGKRIRVIVAAVSLCGLGHQVAACNSVLGIEEAELDESLDGGSCEFTWVEPVKECIPNEECELCLGQCEGFHTSRDDCLADQGCRTALQNHRWCLNVDQDCSDEAQNCLNCLPTSGPGQGVRNCMTECSGVCDGTGVYSLCELYCACMAAQCPNQTITLLNGTETTDCGAYCAEQTDADAWKTSCRLSHCSLAENPPDPSAITDHCRHAVSLDGMCTVQEAQETFCLGGDDPDKKLNGHGCDLDSECCSGECISGSCHAVGVQ